MSSMHTYLDARRRADLDADPDFSAPDRSHRITAAIDTLATLLAQREARQAERAVLNTAGQAINAAMRPGFDRDYGSYTANPSDPRTPDDDDAAGMRAQIVEAQARLEMALSALDVTGPAASLLAVRSLMTEAMGWLVEG